MNAPAAFPSIPPAVAASIIPAAIASAPTVPAVAPVVSVPAAPTPTYQLILLQWSPVWRCHSGRQVINTFTSALAAQAACDLAGCTAVMQAAAAGQGQLGTRPFVNGQNFRGHVIYRADGHGSEYFVTRARGSG